MLTQWGGVMKKSVLALVSLGLLVGANSFAGVHEGRDSIEKTGYKGPETCEECHPGTAKAFLSTVHWKHASLVDNVEGLEPGKEYGMKNRIYAMCDGNDVVNNLKEIPPNAEGKTKLTGCNTCHPGDHASDVGSTGPEAENAIDCLLCHSSKYDYSKRKPYKAADGRILIGQDRSLEAALNVGKPSVKNCTICHETAGGGYLFKRGFEFNAKNDVHAAKGMTCAECHKGKDHKMASGFDPNNWANDGIRFSCPDCHTDAPHKEDEDLNRHTARIACQTCHNTRTGGAYAKDFTKWELGTNKFYEPNTLYIEGPEASPVYAWYNNTVRNTPTFIGPKGSRVDQKSKIFPFKLYEARAYFDKLTGNLMAMDFAQPMATGDTLAGVASAAKTLGIEKYEPVPGWQRIYFANSHLVTKTEALKCQQCHAVNGVLNFSALGYNDQEVVRLTSASVYFDKQVGKKKSDDW